MSTQPLFRAVTSFADLVRATVVASWPRSAVRYEVARLREEGHVRGTTCEMAFSVWVDDTSRVSEAALASRAAGFALDLSAQSRGFLTARTTVALRPFALARELTRLERAVRACGGCVEVIGPVGAPHVESSDLAPQSSSPKASSIGACA